MRLVRAERGSRPPLTAVVVEFTPKEWITLNEVTLVGKQFVMGGDDLQRKLGDVQTWIDAA